MTKSKTKNPTAAILEDIEVASLDYEHLADADIQYSENTRRSAEIAAGRLAELNAARRDADCVSADAVILELANIVAGATSVEQTREALIRLGAASLVAAQALDRLVGTFGELEVDTKESAIDAVEELL